MKITKRSSLYDLQYVQRNYFPNFTLDFIYDNRKDINKIIRKVLKNEQLAFKR